MSWFPTFLNPLMAAVAAAIAIPALLILYFLKLRRREQTVPSTLLWRKAIQDLQVNAPFQKLRRNLLLFLQLLLLALLLLALSRPVSQYAPGAGKMTVVLIDRSASMSAVEPDGRTRLDEAKRRATDLVETLQRNSQAMVIAFDEKAETVQPFTADVPALKRAIDNIKPTDGKSRLKMAYQLAEAQANYNPDQLRSLVKPDVWVFSDGRVLDGLDLRITGELKYDKVGSDDLGNVAIVAMNARRNYERPTEVQVFARLANFGTEPVKADVQLVVDGRTSRVAGTTLLPERWTDAQRDEAEKAGNAARESVEFTLELTDAAVVRVEHMAQDGDALKADNAAEVVVPPPKPMRVLLVSDGNYFLEKALGSLNIQRPDSMIPTAFEQKQPADYDVIIFDRYSPKWLPEAGNFMYFGGTAPGSPLKPVKLETDPTKNVILTEIGVLDWKRDHPILRHLSLSKIYVAEAMKLEVPREAEVLMDGLKGPLVVLHRQGPSLHLVTAFDVLQSNWPLRISFPYFMHNALQFMAVGTEMDVRQSFEPGATPRIPRATLQKVQGPGGEPLKSLTLRGPGSERTLPVPEQGDFALPALDRVGVYELDPPVPQFERLAVNLLDANESNLVPVETPPGGVGEAIAGAQGKSRLELWWWIVACAALPLLLVEWYVYTRRVHL